MGNISSYAETKQKINATNANPSIWGLDLEDIEKGGRLLKHKTVGERKAVGNKTIFYKGDILYSKLRPYLLKILIAPDDGICTPEIIPFCVYGGIIPDYIVYYLKSPHVNKHINSITYGVKMPRVGTETMTNLVVPIPPLREQQRIVEKIAEVTPAIFTYDELYPKAELLNSTFPKLLKKSILQEAVQGKLVPQDPNDEPASVLLERIREAKQRLIKEGKIKKNKHESVIFRRDNSHYEKLDGVERCIDDEIPFEIPESWVWCRLGTVIKLQSGQDMTPNKYNSSGKGFPYITGASNIEKGKVLINRWTEHGKSFAYKGDILLTCKGTVGTMAILQEEQVHIARQIMAVRPLYAIYVPYIQIVLKTLVSKLKTVAKSMIPGISRKDVLAALLPLPPQEEQIRIAKKLVDLFPLIEEYGNGQATSIALFSNK